MSNRIAIKFAAPRGPPKPPRTTLPPPSALGKRHRVTDRPDSDHSNDDDDEKYSGRHESIVTFGGDDDVAPLAKRERVIGPQKDQGWRAQLHEKRRLQLQRMDHEVVASGVVKNGQGRDHDGEEAREELKLNRVPEDSTTQWGLVVSQKRNESRPSEAPDAEKDTKDTTTITTSAAAAVEESAAGDNSSLTADAEAMRALLDERPARKQAVIIKLSEDDAYRRAHSDAPDESTLEDYENMPVEEFGAALLRGMGWNGDMGPKQAAPVRRPQGLGLGSKQLKADEDLGAWDTKAGLKKSSRPPRLDEYRRSQAKRTEERSRGHDSYKRERDREKEQERYGREREYPRYRDRDRDRTWERRDRPGR